MTLINTLSKLNNSIITFLESPIIKYGFLIFIIIQILIIKKLSTTYLQIFDDNLFKIIFAFLIAYYACFDPIYSIALTTLMIISIQEVHSRNATHDILSLLPEPTHNSYMYNINNKNNDNNNNINLNNTSISTINDKNTFDINSDKITAKIFDNDELVFELINKHSLQKKPSSNDKLTAEYELCNNQPAYKTITDNITDNITNTTSMDLLNKSLNKPISQSLIDIQNNKKINVNQNESYQELKGDILNIQGLPNGFDPKNKYISLE